MSNALVVGSANADLVYSVTEFPKPGETITSQGFTVLAGGKGANQAVAAARAGASVELCASIGDDGFGQLLREVVSTNGAGTSFVQTVPHESGSAVIFVNRHGENEIVLNPGANYLLKNEHVTNTIQNTNPGLILTQLEIPDEAVVAVLQQKHKTILNPAPFKNLEGFELDGLFAITPNESECRSITGHSLDSDQNIREAAKFLIDKGVRNVIITLGKRGCFWTDGQEEIFVPSPSVNAVDTTGAGDVFNGALVAHLLAHSHFSDALRFAVTAASISTTRHGALESAPYCSEIMANLA